MAHKDQFGHLLHVGDKVMGSARRFKEKFDAQEATVIRLNKYNVTVRMSTGPAEHEVKKVCLLHTPIWIEVQVPKGVFRTKIYLKC